MLTLFLIFWRISIILKVVKLLFLMKIQSIVKSRAGMLQLALMDRSHLKAMSHLKDWSHLKACKRKINKKMWSSMLKIKPYNPTEISLKTLKTPRILSIAKWIQFNLRQKNSNLRALMSLQWSWEKNPHKRRENQSSSTKTQQKFLIKQNLNQLKIRILLLHQKQTL